MATARTREKRPAKSSARNRAMPEKRSSQPCPVCLAAPLQPFFEMTDVPVYCNVLWPTREKALACALGTIQLAFCRGCGLMTNQAFEPERLEYNQDYENSLHFSPRFQAYAESLAQHLIARYDLRGKDIIEIGCGKGDFLALLCQLGNNRGVGFDRSYVTGRVSPAVGGGVRFVQDFFSERYADCPCDLFCCRQTLEHLTRPTEFLNTIRRTLERHPRTAVFFEVPNGMWTLRDMGIWDIIYEHCSFFCPESLARLFRRCGFRVREIREAYDGQFLCLEAALGDAAEDALPKERKELDCMARDVALFGESYRAKVGSWRHTLEQLRQSGKRAVVWGAGSKGVTFLNTFRMCEGLDYVVDINPHKQGMFVPGTGQRIVAPDFLRDYRPTVVLVMNPIYRNEIARQAAEVGLQAEFLVV